MSELRQWLPSEFEGTKLRRLNFDEHMCIFFAAETLGYSSTLDIHTPSDGGLWGSYLLENDTLDGMKGQCIINV